LSIERREIKMRKILFTYLPASLFLAFLAMILVSCGGGGDGSNSGTTPTPPSTKSVVITGTVPGTVAIAYDLATGKEAARDIASGTPKTFSLSVAPGAYYLMFIQNEGTPAQRSFAFRNVTGGNVFTFKANTTLDLGVLVFNTYPGVVPLNDPISGKSNVTETSMPEASFSPGPGEWTATTTFVNSTCPGHSPGATVTENVKIAHGYGLVTYTPAGTAGTVGGVANVNTAILTGSGSSLVTIYLTMQPDGSLAGMYSKVGYGGECSEEGTLAAVLGTSLPPPPPAVTLTGLSINGPSSMPEYGTAAYTATASWSDNSTSTVTPTWSVNSQVAEINTGGVLYCQRGVASDQSVVVSATYSAGGITETATMDVTIIHPHTMPFTAQELSGKVFFYGNFLYILNADFTLKLYAAFGTPPGDPSYYVTGTWSNDPDGLDLNFRFADYAGSIVQRIADSSTEMEVEVFEKGWEYIHIATWEKTMSVDPVKLPGTYRGSDGYTWVFNNDGTGTGSIFSGIKFTWSVDSTGVLRMPSTTGYTAVFYARASSQSTATSYTNLKVGFAEHNTATGNFYKYYGGYELTRQ
jgi:hypothetical protein